MEDLKTKKLPVLNRALPKKIASGAVCALIGFCLAAVQFEKSLSPFAAAFTAGARSAYLLPAALGSAVGALVFHAPMDALKYIGAVTLIFLFRTANDRFLKAGRTVWITPLVAFSSVLVCAVVTGAALGTDVSGVVVAVCEALIAGACAAFSMRVFALLPGGLKTLGATAGDTAALLVSGSVLLLALDQFRIWQISPAHVVGFFGILLLGAAGEGAGAAAGISAGLMLGFGEGSAYLAYFLPAAGLACGIARGFGKLAAAGAFAVLGAMFLVLKGSADTALPAILEIVAAALLFALLPKRALSAAAQALRPVTGERYAAETKAVVRLRLRAAAKAIRDVAESVQAVCSLFRTPPRLSPEEAAGAVKAEVCAGCRRRDVCWGPAAAETRAAFVSLRKTLEQNGTLVSDDAPGPLRAACVDRAAVLASFERGFCEENAGARAEEQISDVKALTAGQFSGLADVLEDAASAAAAIGETDPYLAQLAADVFTAAGFAFSSLSVSSDENGRALLEVFCTRIPRLPDTAALLRRLREKTNIEFMPPVQDEYKKEGAVLTFCEKTALRTEFYKCCAPAKGENLCGDTAEAFADGRGGYFCVLSDGMGTGRSAAMDSVMTCSLFSRLMRAGFSPEAALGAVNCALMVRPGEESLATLDLLRLDLNTGKAVFYKAGGALSAVRRAGRTAVVEKASLPLGIMREAKFERSETDLSAGDAVLLLSDGASVLPRSFFKELFAQHKDSDARTLAQAALAAAVERAPAGAADDITVACVRLLKNDAAVR